MKLTNATEQAIVVMAIVSTQDIKIPVSSETIHTKLSLSPSYIKKLLRKLVVAGLIGSVSGNSGGFYLVQDTKDISILDVIEAIEGPIDTYPTLGLLTKAFQDFENVAQEGTHIIKQFVFEADTEWREHLSNKTIQDVLDAVFQTEDTSINHNWNDLT